MFEKINDKQYRTDQSVNACLEALLDAAKFKKYRVKDIDRFSHTVEFVTPKILMSKGDVITVQISEENEDSSLISFSSPSANAASHFEAEVLGVARTLTDGGGTSGSAW